MDWCTNWWGVAKKFFGLRQNETPTGSLTPDSAIQSRTHPPVPVHPSLEILSRATFPGERVFNVLLIGPSGAGKSTLINSMINYFKYDKLTDAIDGDLAWTLPCKFTVQDDEYELHSVYLGEDDNEQFNDTGQSVTQLPQVHQLQHGAVTFNLIDTPGLRDSRGVDQDEKNLEAIREAVRRAGTLHAICFVLLPNEAKMGAGLELVFRKLLSLFSVDAFPNVCFFFTNSCGTLFRPGDSIQPIRHLQATMKEELGADLPFGKDNVFCVDSDAFRYLVALKEAPNFCYGNLKDFEYNWGKSRDAVRRFLLAVQQLKPYTTEKY